MMAHWPFSFSLLLYSLFFFGVKAALIFFITGGSKTKADKKQKEKKKKEKKKKRKKKKKKLGKKKKLNGKNK